MHCELNPKYEHLHSFVEKIPEIFESEGTVVYEDRNVVKTMKSPDGTLLNVKRYHPPHGLNLFVYSFGIRKPKGKRAFQYPSRLRQADVPTPEEVAYIEERHAGLLAYSYFVSLQSPYEHRMYELGNAPEGTYEELAQAFALFTAHMHEHEVMHLDYSPGNILWQINEAGEYHFTLVDINRMHFGPVTMEQGCRNFKRLWGPKRFFQLIVKHYAEARHFPPAESEAIALAERRKFWTRYGRRHPIHFNLEL